VADIAADSPFNIFLYLRTGLQAGDPSNVSNSPEATDGLK